MTEMLMQHCSLNPSFLISHVIGGLTQSVLTVRSVLVQVEALFSQNRTMTHQWKPSTAAAPLLSFKILWASDSSSEAERAGEGWKKHLLWFVRWDLLWTDNTTKSSLHVRERLKRISNSCGLFTSSLIWRIWRKPECFMLQLSPARRN